jgi:hypothetical protein
LKPSGELLLIVALDDGAIFGEQPTQPDCRRHLAIGEMMNDLARRPLVASGPRIELRVGGACKRRFDDGVAVLVLLNQCVASRCCHCVSLVPEITKTRNMKTRDW